MTIEEIVRDERWEDSWILWPPQRCGDPMYPWLSKWTVHDEATADLPRIAEGDTAAAAAQSALQTKEPSDG